MTHRDIADALDSLLDELTPAIDDGGDAYFWEVEDEMRELFRLLRDR